jgi:GTP cyclohydrolase IA
MNQEVVAECISRLIREGLGLDLNDPNLSETPNRIAKMYCKELITAFDTEPPNIKSFPSEHYDEIIMFDNIPYTSLCSHHFLPFSGRAWLLYIPHTKVIGASKSARLINYFSGKPQLQEKLSMEVIDYLCDTVKPLGAMLVMRAIHGCMSCRGVKTGLQSGMTTSVTRGAFRDDQNTRNEAMQLIHLSIMDRG